MKKQLSKILAFSLLLSSLPFTAWENGLNFSSKADNVLRVASWDEYIDMGGSVYADYEENKDFIDWYEDVFGIKLSEKTKPLYEEFVDWYHENYKDSENYQKNLVMEYIPLQDNETMYNKIKMGDRYDLLCPSEYMAMKLKAENLIEPFATDFFDESVTNNFYAQHTPRAFLMKRD